MIGTAISLIILSTLIIILLSMRKEYDTMHLVLNYTNKEIPTHFILFKDNKVIDVVKYDDKSAWNHSNNEITFKKDKYYSQNGVIVDAQQKLFLNI